MAKTQRYQSLDNEEKLIEALNDKLEALTTIYRNQPQATAIAHLEAYIDSLFSDEHSPITLSTCHRAKGLEGDRIFILKPEDMPMTWRHQQDWQKEQEDNLLYVALTRSKSELYIVGEPNWFIKEPETPETTETTPDPEPAEVESVEPEAVELSAMVPVPVVSVAATLPQQATTIQERIAQALFADPHRSDRAIALECGVSAPTVGKVRKRLGLTLGERVDRLGRTLNTEKIGSKERTAKEKILKLIEELTPEEIREIIEILEDLA